MNLSLNPIKWFTKGVEVVGKTVVNVKGAWSGNKQEQDQQQSAQFMAGLQAYSKEFAPRQNRTMWDSLWDGLNRMPRPLIVVAVFSYFGLAYANPNEFQILNVALDTVPENMWYVMSAIVSFYFMSREFQKGRDTKMALNDTEFQKVQERISKIRESDKPVTDNMLKLELIRRSDNGRCSIGELRTDKGVYYTVERPWLDNKPFVSCIPEGEYICKRYSSTKYPNTFQVTGVHGRTKILFHVANWAKDVQGCIGLGNGLLANNSGVGNSKQAMNKFKNEMKDVEEFKLTVINSY